MEADWLFVRSRLTVWVIETFDDIKQLAILASERRDPDTARRWRSFFPRLANRRSIERRRGQRRKRGSRPLFHSPLTRTAGALAEARRHHSSQTQTVAEAARSHDGLTAGLYIGAPNANERANKRTNLPTYTMWSPLVASSSQLYRQFRASILRATQFAEI